MKKCNSPAFVGEERLFASVRKSPIGNKTYKNTLPFVKFTA